MTPRRAAANARRAREFLERHIWDADLAALPRAKAAAYGFLRMLTITALGTFRDRLPLRAAALTFTTLLSIVPFLAIGLSVAKGLGFKNRVEATILSRIPPAWPEDLRNAVHGVFSQVEATNFRALGTMGLVVVLLAAVRLLATIERAFNDVWGIREGRTFARRFSDFLAAIVVMPLLMLAATSANAFLASDRVVGWLASRAGPLLPVYLLTLRLAPFVFLWTAFSAVYAFMPNTRVRIASAVVGGVVAGTAWQVLQWLTLHFQIGIARYNAIYGTFAALPIFLAWLQASWLIVLFGAEVSFAHQNYRTYQMEAASRASSFAAREALGLEAACAAAKAFLEGRGPWDPEPWAAGRRFPVRLARGVLDVLVAQGILAATQGPSPRYMPARDPRRIPVVEVLAALRDHGERLAGQPARAAATLIADARAGAEKALADRTLADAAEGPAA